jgi:hypothetical protein
VAIKREAASMARQNQIIARVTLEQKSSFEGYARCLGLNAAYLLRLLIVRELHQKKLESSSTNLKRGRSSFAAARRLGTVPVRLEADNETVFLTRAKQLKQPKSVVASRLIVLELEEQWLLHAVVSSGVDEKISRNVPNETRATAYSLTQNDR